MKIGLGTVQFGLSYGISNASGRVTPSEVRSILSLADQCEIDTIDTAISYGVSEAALGQCGVESFKVVTKLPPMPSGLDDIKTWVAGEIDSSLLRLKSALVHGLLLHRPQDLLGPGSEELIKVLRDLREAEIVTKIGVSVYGPDELEVVQKRMQFDLVQCPVNVIDRRMERSGWLRRLKDEGVEIHARSIFLQGLLLLDPERRADKFSRWSRLWEMWGRELDRANIAPLDACLAYPLSLNEVDRVIVGVETAMQLQAIVDASKSPQIGFDSSFMECSDVELINPSCWSKL